jgi:cell division protein FtsZ
VFGVGGAGGNAVNNMIDKNLEGVEFVVANTDAQALQQSRARSRIQMGVKVTEGLGAGARAAVGAAAAEETIEEIVDHLAGAHMCFITAGMGGGTGTGAAPIIAQAARELGVLTVGVVTKPFQFEGAKRMKQAEDGVEALQRVVDTLIIIPNQNLFRLANEKTTFSEAFAMADDVLYQGVKGVTDLMVRPGLINLDFADVRAVMDEMGKAMMGTGEASGEDRARQAAEKAIANPLLDEISLHGARGVLINITGGHDLTLFELDEAANLIREKVDGNANIIVGSTLDASMEGMMRVSVVATGIDAAPISAETPVPRRRMAVPLDPPLRLEEEVVSAPAPEVFAPAAARAPEPTLFDGYAHQDTAAQNIEAFEDEEMPAPAYAPARQAAPQHAPRPRATAEQFIAPTPRAPGTPTPEALARLRAAIDRKPAAPVVAPRPEPVAQPAADTRGGRFGINSLINRMTGHAPEAPLQPAAPRAAPAGPVRQERYSGPAAPAPQSYAEDHEAQDAERERIEIPAFLRRQAN